jgi:hypothetical protein
MMSSLSLPSTSDSATLSVPKLRDDGSNWSDYEPRLKKAMGVKGLWAHVEGRAAAPKPYQMVNGIYLISDGKTPATEEQVEHRESRIMEHEHREYLAQHVILSTTSVRVGAFIKHLNTAKEMWEKVKQDATNKSTLYLIDAEDQLANMRVSDADDPKTHLSELKDHFNQMLTRRDNLVEMGSMISTTRFATMIMASLPGSYRSAIQTITAAEKMSSISGTSKTMSPTDLMGFFMEEAEHRVINDERSKAAESALLGHRKGNKKNTLNPKERSDKTCENCKKQGHTKPECWAKGGGKEGEGPKQNTSETKEKESAAVAEEAKNDNDESFAFTCTSDYSDLTVNLCLPKVHMC